MLKRIKSVLNTDKARNKIDNIALASIIIAIIAINLAVPVTKYFHSEFLFWLMIVIAAVGCVITIASRLWYFKDEITDFKDKYYSQNFEEMEELKREKRHGKIKKH